LIGDAIGSLKLGSLQQTTLSNASAHQSSFLWRWGRGHPEKLLVDDVIGAMSRATSVKTTRVANLVRAAGCSTMGAFAYWGELSFPVRAALMLFLMRCLFLWLSHDGRTPCDQDRILSTNFAEILHLETESLSSSSEDQSVCH
jgi:hypothetical protein